MQSRLVLLLLALACALVACGPGLPDGSLDEVDEISGGDELLCAHRRDGSTWCWGDGALSGGGGTSSFAKQAVLPGIERVSSMGAQMCVILQDHSVACSEASFGTFNPSWAPVPPRTVPEPSAHAHGVRLGRVSGLDNVVQVGVGTYIDCARRDDGTVACWGDAAEVLRTGTYDRKRPIGVRVANGHQVADVGSLPAIRDLSVGDWSALAIGDEGSVWTLGGLARGVERVSSIDDAVEAASGRAFHCVRRRKGEVLCWRDGASAEGLGLVDKTPVRIDIPAARKIAAGPWGACALLEDGGTACWGSDHALTQVRTASWVSPERISHATGLRSLVVGGRVACGVDPGGHVLCWGDARRLGVGYEGSKYATRGPQKMGWVQLSAAGEAVAQALRDSWFTGGAGLLGVLVALVSARRLRARVTEVWRRLPGAPLLAGAGYRAAEIAMTRERAPRLVRAALTLALASAGADSAFVVVFDRLVSATGKVAFVAGAVASIGWMVLVVVAVAAVARGSKRALRRWSIVGAVGLTGHAGLGYVSANARYELAWLLAGKHYPPPAASLDIMAEALQLASVIGIAASIVLIAASRHHRELP